MLSLNARKHGHGIGRGGLNTIVRSAGAQKEIVARPGHVVPGNDAV